jgi:hypothetical protein
LAPEEIRTRLHERLEQAPAPPTWGTLPDVPLRPSTTRRWLPGRGRHARTNDAGLGVLAEWNGALEPKI